jgi:cytochrome c-type biogenesis protein CcmH/NrfG
VQGRGEEWVFMGKVYMSSEMKCSVGKGEEWVFMGKVYMTSKTVRSKGLGLYHE